MRAPVLTIAALAAALALCLFAYSAITPPVAQEGGPAQPGLARLAVSASPTPSHTAASTPYVHPKLDLSQHPEGVYRGPLQGWWQFSERNVTSEECEREFRVPAGSPLGKWRRFKAASMGKCLAGKDILLVGDGLVYQLFQAMTIMLSTGAPGNPLNPPNHPNGNRIVNGKYRVDSTELWECEFKRGFLCDHIYAHGMSNVYYHNRQYGINVTYIGYKEASYGHYPIGHAWMMEEGGPAHPGFTPIGFDWEWGNIARVAEEVLKGIGRQDVALLNVGLFHPTPFDTKEPAAIAEAIRPLEGVMKAGKPVWLTTTLDYEQLGDITVPALSDLLTLDAGSQAALSLQWRVFDRAAMVKTLLLQLKRLGYYNALNVAYANPWEHEPYVVTEFVNSLLNMLCP